MLSLVFAATEDYEELEVQLEHSLVSLSKWESIHKKPFFSKEGKDEQEFIDYIACMLLSDGFEKVLKTRLTPEHLEITRQYINDSHTATTFQTNPNDRPSREIVTSELIYHWLIALSIPFQPTETWHLNRLMTLVQVCGIKQTKPKKMSSKERMEQYRMLNEQRRRELGSSG